MGSGEPTCRANQTDRMGCAGGPLVCDVVFRPVELVAQKFIDARLSLFRHVNFLWYIFSSRWRVVIREASNPPWAGRRGGYCLAAPRFAAAVLDRRVAL
jgi:hypothetical protein